MQTTNDEFFSFPRTPHLHGSAAADDDRVLSAEETSEFLAHPLMVEEKVDGANVGVWFRADGAPVLQSRGHALKGGDHPQYAIFHQWVWERIDSLRETLGERRVLFGELLFARHRIAYTNLPDWFVAYDVLDRGAGRFVSVQCRNDLLAGIAPTVPVLATDLRVTSVEELVSRLHGTSAFGAERSEGLYLRRDDGAWSVTRAKWVRSGFEPGNPNWSRTRVVERNSRKHPGND